MRKKTSRSHCFSNGKKGTKKIKDRNWYCFFGLLSVVYTSSSVDLLSHKFTNLNPKDMKNPKQIYRLLTSLKSLVSSAILLPGSKNPKYKYDIRNYCINILYTVQSIERYFEEKEFITPGQLNLINSHFKNLNKLIDHV